VPVGRRLPGREVIQIIAARRPTQLAGKVSRCIFRNQFLEKVFVALQATCSSHHAFFTVRLSHQGSCARVVLVVRAMPTARNGGSRIITPSERSRDAAMPPEAAGLGRLR
jgi:hypothetical protein